MLEEVTRLLELQRLDQKLERLEHKIAEVPQAVQAVEADLAKKRVRLDSAQARISDAEKKKRKLEQDIEDGKSRASKLDAQLMGVKTNQEYRSMLTQIQVIRQQNSDKETEILLMMEQAAELQAERQGALKEFSVLEGLAKVELDARRKHGEELNEERRMAQERRKQLASSLDSKLVAQYEKIRKKWKNNALAELRGEICTGCNLSLRPQHGVHVREGKQIYTCENCHRILYRPDPPPEETTEPGTE